MSLIQTIKKSDAAGTALWKLPGLLPKSPGLAASQTLLWISKLIMEVNSVGYVILNLFCHWLILIETPVPGPGTKDLLKSPNNIP